MIQRNRQSHVESLEGRQLLSAAWGTQAKLIGQDLVAQQFPQLTGGGQTVAVIDSGVDYNHPALGGGWGKKVIAGWDFASNDSDPMSSSNAHGTGTASMIAATPYDYKGYHYSGIAPGVKIIALRESNTTGVMNAFKWVIANKVKYNITAVNFTDFGGGNKTTAASIKASLATLNGMGVYLTAPSGNSGAKGGVPGYSIEETVGSVTKSDTISGFTNRGPGLDFLAPGDKIAVPYYDVGSKKHIYVDSGVGTSWSAPQIAGAAVLLRQINPKFTNAQITSILQQTGAKKYDSATKLSYARLNLYGAVRLALQLSGKSVPPPVTPGPSNPDPSGPDDNVPTPVPNPDPQAPGGVFTSTRTKIGTGTTVIQAENFDSGAEGAAYHDTDKVNKGGNNYRPGTGVDIIALGGKATNRGVGIVKAGEWLKYSVAVQTAGSYNVSFNVAALGSGGAFHLEVDGKNVTGTINVTDTKSWTKYANVGKNGISLTAGNHTLRLVFDKNGKTGYVGNFDAITITKGVSRSTPSPAPTPAPAPKPPAIPSNFTLTAGKGTTIQAEDFTAFRDLTAQNEGGKYRNTAVDVEKTADTGGGFDVGFMKATEWLSYAVNVTKAGTFNLDARVASAFSGGAFHVEVDGKNVTGTMKFTNTGGFQKWTTLRKGGVKLAAGKHTIKLVVDSTGGHKFAGNVNWIKFS